MAAAAISIGTWMGDPRAASLTETCHRCGGPAIHALPFVWTANGRPMGGSVIAVCEPCAQLDDAADPDGPAAPTG